MFRISDFGFRISGSAGLCLLAATLSAGAGSFSTDFNSGPPSGATAYGNAFVDSSGGVGDSGVLKLTTAANNQLSSFIIDDLDSGSRVSSFDVTFKLLLGGGTTPGADGISFNFATDLPNAAFNEEGAGSGLTIVFDAYDNGTGDIPEGPEFRIKYGGNLVANRKLSTQFQTGANFVDVHISYTTSGTITLVYNGVVMFTNMFVFGPLPTGARFGFGARTGGLNQNQFIDDLNITTTTISRFYVKGSFTPATSTAGASPDTPVQVVLQDFGAAVDPTSVAMNFNGCPVNPTVTKAVNNVTTVSYDPPGSLLYSSLNHVNFTFSDSSGPPLNALQYDFAVASGPLWSLAPGSRPYVSTDASSTPFQRSIAYNALSNQVYIISRTGAITGLTINVVDAATGADLYKLNTNGISGGNIVLLAMAVAADGAIYAANETSPTSTNSNPFKIYRWANSASTTPPQLVFSGEPANPASTTFRWGDSLAVRGAGANTQIIVDATNAQSAVILAPSDSFLTNFVPTLYNHSYLGNTIGRGLQFGPTNTFFLKKKASAPQPLQLIRYDTPPTTTTLISTPNFYQQLGPLAVDVSKNLAAGIFFVTNSATPDRLLVFDISNLNSPFQVAQYNFPVNHQPNANFIGEVVFGPDKIFAVDGNNGVIAVSAFPPLQPRLTINRSGANVVLSWSNSAAAFVLQSTPSLLPPAWANVAQPATVLGGQSFVTDITGPAGQFYRLIKP